jgi:hypothetical protein
MQKIAKTLCRRSSCKAKGTPSKPIYNIMPFKAISPLASPSSSECEKGK